MNIFTQNFSHLIGGSGRGFCLFVSMKRGKMMTLHSKYWRMKPWTQFQVSILIYYQVCDRHIELDHLVNGHVDYFFIESINQMWKKAGLVFGRKGMLLRKPSWLVETLFIQQVSLFSVAAHLSSQVSSTIVHWKTVQFSVSGAEILSLSLQMLPNF